MAVRTTMMGKGMNEDEGSNKHKGKKPEGLKDELSLLRRHCRSSMAAGPLHSSSLFSAFLDKKNIFENRKSPGEEMEEDMIA